MELDGKRIIVTGGAQGIGASIVHAYTRAGASVGAMDVKEEFVAKVAEEASARGPGTAHFTRCDVADQAEVRAAFRAFADAHGGLDVLVNAAGIELRSPAEDISEDDWDRTFDVNVKGTFFTNQLAFSLMKETGGAIINFASGAGVNGFPQHGHYAASKGAVLSWTRTAAAEWGRYGITVNSICPGMWTPMYDAHRSRLSAEELVVHDAQIAAVTPIDGRLGDPDRDLAPFMVFMASDGARYITAQTLVVDGGRTVAR
jgi:NAD(P)-dependent dehydrogenase (short-subunit alcohol dehydrogenase family)